MYEGIFTKTFTLFYGETLHYYFHIERNGEVRETVERTVTMKKIEGIPGSKYQLLNQLLSARRLGKNMRLKRTEALSASGTVCERNVCHRKGTGKMNETRDLIIGIDFGKKIFTDLLL